ncbi:HAMP domain-containing histidine kinase [Exiguobacterium sp. SH0S7]|uniref:HAMP domain-containing sensor histidine kinase n=1 Tax=Exiguobacterium sp. SH0S7 TaxID=2510951 RepID=UPI00103EFEB6|nr:HAMP domain-containing sensor histidine kinase [Exiguobacterium sp. SH0S7]TCI71172.1 HAMP domain-containing histidine kinase [Exiguobacterium sp. SH0S7]
MKWKLTGRYLVSILAIVAIVVILNVVILVTLLVNDRTGIDDVESNSGETFTRTFNQYMSLEDGAPVVNEDGITALEEFGAFIQILDASGDVVSDVGAPVDAPDAYSPIELIQIYKYKDDDLVLYFVGEFETYSYLIGVPDAKEDRALFMLDPEAIFAYVSRATVILLIVDLAVAALIGLAFSSILTRPVYRLTERIAQLKARDFSTVEPKRPGMYRPVFANLNDVSQTLTTYESEREQLERRRKEWMSNVSHDLKTPLASIQGYAELLEDTGIDETERRQYAEVIERQALYMKELLDDFNLTMRLQHGDFPLKRETTGLEPFVRELVIDVLNDPRFATRDITFSSTDAASRDVDRHFMKRALLNFIYNALLHNDESVTVCVTVLGGTIIVQDDGNGIDEADLPYIFERYYRGTNTTDALGSGLGMAISRDIIKAHGGTVTVTSDLGVGTTIQIDLP